MRQLSVFAIAALFSGSVGAHPLPAEAGQLAVLVHDLVSPDHPLMMAMLLISGLVAIGIYFEIRRRKS